MLYSNAVKQMNKDPTEICLCLQCGRWKRC